jgi:hypothetical protein
MNTGVKRKEWGHTELTKRRKRKLGGSELWNAGVYRASPAGAARIPYYARLAHDADSTAALIFAERYESRYEICGDTQSSAHQRAVSYCIAAPNARRLRTRSSGIFGGLPERS